MSVMQVKKRGPLLKETDKKKWSQRIGIDWEGTGWGGSIKSVQGKKAERDTESRLGVRQSWEEKECWGGSLLFGLYLSVRAGVKKE